MKETDFNEVRLVINSVKASTSCQLMQFIQSELSIDTIHTKWCERV